MSNLSLFNYCFENFIIIQVMFKDFKLIILVIHFIELKLHDYLQKFSTQIIHHHSILGFS